MILNVLLTPSEVTARTAPCSTFRGGPPSAGACGPTTCGDAKCTLFGPGHSRYDPENDRYLRWAGQASRCQSEDRHNRRKGYRGKPSICDACELKAGCTTSERGRVPYRPFEEDYYDGARLPTGELFRTRRPYCANARCG